MTSIRFSPNPNQAHRIDWLPWARSTFDRAQAEDKPVLLSISAAWCYWCHVMDETTYSDPDVQSLLARSFVAVRVDNDHRPDINARYNVGGWPTTAFLTPHGGLIGGATYLPPDQFLAMLMELQDAYRTDKPRLYEQSRDLLQRRREHARTVSAGAEVEPTLADRVSRIVAGAYDSKHGGFGADPKFTNPAILRFVLHLYRTTGEEFYAAMLRKSLDSLADSPMRDKVDGGFYRYSAVADWSEPQHEKLLEDNLQLAQVYLDAAIILDPQGPGDGSRYRDIGEGAFAYLNGHLYDAGLRGFHGSQGAHSDYFSLDKDGRAASAPPPCDPSCYGGPDALAAAAMLDASWKVDSVLGKDLTKTGLDVITRLEEAVSTGEFSRVHPEAEPGSSPPLFSDWAGLLMGLMQAHASTAEPRFLERSVEVAKAMVDRFFDESHGGFFDIENDENAVGHLQIREKQLPENMLAVRGLMKLYNATRNDDYRQVCEATLSAFASVYREHGEFAADFGLAVDIFSNQMIEITVEGDRNDPACRELIAAAARMNGPNLEIKTVAASTGPALAHVCLDTLCLPPVFTPEELEKAVASVDEQPDSPFQDILRIFPGN